MNVKTKIDKFLELYSLPLEELIEISAKITQENFGNKVEFCSIVSAKTGKCSENCNYCAQSSHHKAQIITHPLISLDEVKKCALEAKNNGASRFSIVTSGKGPDQEDFNNLLEMIQSINEIPGLKACASIGILNEKQVKALKDAGLIRYHHNLNTCKSYHNEVCTTHTYEERINTIKLVNKYGIEVCAGGIIGMGETSKQRVELALELAELDLVSVPVNFLHPIPGTPFEVHENAINEDEILRTLAIFRIAMPETNIRYAGGRTLRLSSANQELGLKLGVNGILVGNYLTTIGTTPEEDRQMVVRAGKQVG